VRRKNKRKKNCQKKSYYVLKKVGKEIKPKTAMELAFVRVKGIRRKGYQEGEKDEKHRWGVTKEKKKSFDCSREEEMSRGKDNLLCA